MKIIRKGILTTEPKDVVIDLPFDLYEPIWFFNEKGKLHKGIISQVNYKGLVNGVEIVSDVLDDNDRIVGTVNFSTILLNRAFWLSEEAAQEVIDKLTEDCKERIF